MERLKQAAFLQYDTKPAYEDSEDTLQESMDIAAFGDEDLYGITEEEVDAQCDELFENTPIKFKPRKSDPVDQMIAAAIKANEVKVPVVWIKGNLYLVGNQRLNCEVKADKLLVRVGGGY